ncbi:DUF1638 domain-containing protein [Dehalobacterium formicoaceticum]|uniref:DUF1638 domain-containing protein n=1 Tax=Dehalobacterium formicoaceticum TaxID=51515 RepID=UPI000B7CD7B6|nr:DUF1638 domain-containing protein [Dehalobacterium formicoaceticum]
MELCIVACGVFQPELEQVLEQISEELIFSKDIKITYLPPALHVDYNKLRKGITDALDDVTQEKRLLFFGSMCHPELDEFTKQYHVVRLLKGNCIELILDNKRKEEIEKSARVFYLTPGWLRNWQDIFKQGQGWDEIDARQNFGFYDKILLLDTGVVEFDDEDILDFFEYTQVPIEIEYVGLTTFKQNVVEALEKVSVTVKSL